jgi:formylglycine-generating enzyme required for sulfatase activity
MHGNVAEWTLDQYNPGFYEEIAAGAADPWFRPTRLHPRTVRGGAFDDDPEALRCANRLPSSMTWKRRDPQIPKSFWWNTDSPFVGFRLASPVEQPSPEEQAEFWRINLGE